MAHELPQELGDYFAMVTGGGCSNAQALVVNFVGALSSVLGALLFLGSCLLHSS